MRVLMPSGRLQIEIEKRSLAGELAAFIDPAVKFSRYLNVVTWV